MRQLTWNEIKLANEPTQKWILKKLRSQRIDAATTIESIMKHGTLQNKSSIQFVMNYAIPDLSASELFLGTPLEIFVYGDIDGDDAVVGTFPIQKGEKMCPFQSKKGRWFGFFWDKTVSEIDGEPHIDATTWEEGDYPDNYQYIDIETMGEKYWLTATNSYIFLSCSYEERAEAKAGGAIYEKGGWSWYYESNCGEFLPESLMKFWNEIDSVQGTFIVESIEQPEQVLGYRDLQKRLKEHRNNGIRLITLENCGGLRAKKELLVQELNRIDDALQNGYDLEMQVKKKTPRFNGVNFTYRMCQRALSQFKTIQSISYAIKLNSKSESLFSLFNDFLASSEEFRNYLAKITSEELY